MYTLQSVKKIAVCRIHHADAVQVVTIKESKEMEQMGLYIKRNIHERVKYGFNVIDIIKTWLSLSSRASSFENHTFIVTCNIPQQ